MVGSEKTEPNIDGLVWELITAVCACTQAIVYRSFSSDHCASRLCKSTRWFFAPGLGSSKRAASMWFISSSVTPASARLCFAEFALVVSLAHQTGHTRAADGHHRTNTT